MHGTGGRITFWYKQDRVLLQRAGHGPEESSTAAPTCWRTSSTISRTATGLLVAPDSTGAFMKVVEAIRRAPDPGALPAGAWDAAPRENRRVVPGIDGLVAAAADTLGLYSELGAPGPCRRSRARDASRALDPFFARGTGIDPATGLAPAG